MKSHARRRVDVTELRADCPEHPDVLFVRAEGCPLCEALRRIRRATAGTIGGSGPKSVTVTVRHPWKGAR